MRTKRFNFATVLCAFFAAAFLSVGVVMASPVKAADVTNEADQAVFVMDEGASIRVGTDDSTYGVKFTAMMTDANYQKLMAKVGEDKEYASATFGMLIAPASYSTLYGELNYENVFGADAKYDWRTFNTETGKWNDYTSNKTQIINIYGQKLYEVNPVEGEKYWAFQGGAVTKVSSTLLKYQGVGYVELVKADDTKDYIFAVANDNARTAYDVALKALQDTNSGLTEDEIAWIEENYIASTAQDAKFDLGMTSAETIDLAKLGIPAGEYEITAQQYIQKSELVSGAYQYYTETLGEAVTVPTLSEGTVLDVSGLDGIFTINVNYAGTEYGYTIDLERYTPGEFVWNNVMDTKKSIAITDASGNNFHRNASMSIADVSNLTINKGEGRTGNYYKATFASVTKLYQDGLDGFGAKIYPVHSKEYYSTFYTGAKINIDYLWARTDLVNSEAKSSENGVYWRVYKGRNLGFTTTDYASIPDSWEGYASSGDRTRKSLSLSTILNNWDKLIQEQPTSADYNAGSMFGFYRPNTAGSAGTTDSSYTGKYEVYFGNVHLTNASAASYKVEAYNAATGELLQEETVSNVALGTSVSFEPAQIDGYIFDADNQNNLLSAVVDGFGSLTLKAYYTPCVHEDISVDETGAALLRSDATLDFGDIGTIKKYTVTQYVVKTTKVDKTTQTPTAWTQYDVDVTEDYANLFTGSVLDTSTFDGIYTVTAYGTKSIKSIKFEQIKLKEDGTTVFTWNNINEHGHDKVVGAELTGVYGTNAYEGNLTITCETAETDTALAGKAGIFWKVANIQRAVDWTAGDNYRPRIRVFPVHSYDYYNIFIDAAATNMTANMGYITVGGTGSAAATRGWGYCFGTTNSKRGTSGKISDGYSTRYAWSASTSSLDASIVFNLEQYTHLSATRGSGVSVYGSVIGLYGWSSTSTTAIDLYCGNIRA